MSSVTLVSLIAGLLLLLAGKKTFWLFLGLAGVAVAIAFVPRIFPDLDQQTLLLVSIGAGVLGGILAFVCMAFHSFGDFNLQIPATVWLLAVILAMPIGEILDRSVET